MTTSQPAPASSPQSHLPFVLKKSLAQLLEFLLPTPSSAQALKAPAFCYAERLEPRQMLSSIPHPIHNDVIIEGEFHTFTAKSAAKDRTFIDNHNNKVLFTLTGAGTGLIFQATDGEILTLDLSDTKAVTNLNINVTKNKSGTGVTSIADIEIASGGLNNLHAANVNLTHSFISTDSIKGLTLADIGNNILQSNITIGGTSTDKTSITLGAMTDVSIRTFTNVTSFKALDWQDSADDILDTFEASSLGTFAISGRNEVKTKGAVTTTKLAGDLEAGINLTYSVPIGTPPNSPAAKPTVNSVTVAGSAVGAFTFGAHKVNTIAIKGAMNGTLSAGAGFGSITIVGAATDLTVTSLKDITSFKAGHVSQTLLSALGNVGSITTQDWLQGQIIAAKVGSLTTTGRAPVIVMGVVVDLGIPGNFSADLLIKGVDASPNLPSLGTVNIKGSVLGDGTFKGTSNADWIVAGGVGSIKIGAGTDGFALDVRNKDTNKGSLGSYTVLGLSKATQINVFYNAGPISIAGSENLALVIGYGAFSGNLASFTSTKALENTTLAITGAIGSISTRDWEGGSITGTKIGSVTAKSSPATKLAAAIAGNWEVVQINLTGQGLKAGQFTLGPVNIAGQVLASEWRIDGNASTVTVGAFLSSALYVGVSKDISTDTIPTKADFILTAGKTSTLAGFTVTGKAVAANALSFSASRVAAGTLTNVSLRLVNTEGLNPYGLFAVAKIGAYSRFTGQPAPNSYVKVANKTLPGTYDTAGEYVLSIVTNPIAEG